MIKRYFAYLSDSESIGNILLTSVIFSFLIIWVDFKNMPSRYLPLGNTGFIIISVLYLLIFVCSIISKFKLIEALKIQFITLLDKYLVVFIMTEILCILAYIVGFPTSLQNRVLSMPLLLVSIIILGFRINGMEKGFQDPIGREANIIDLQDIYRNKINQTDIKRFYVNEESVDYDLLQREDLINHIYDALINYNPQAKFVVSLEGKWGSGKTTIIKNLKNKIDKETTNVIVIDKFDPWIFSDRESLLENMLNHLLKQSGISFSPLNINRLIAQLKTSILGSKNRGWFNKHVYSEENTHQVKKMINQYLERSGKKVIFIIDNIDRADKDNALLIFKLVSHVFDFKGVTYLLSFDRVQVNRILETEKIDPGYLKKIIQMEVQIPVVDKTIFKEIYRQSLSNIIRYYKGTDFKSDEYTFIVDSIINNEIDLRDFKRLINSVLVPVLSERPYLNLVDKLSIEYIKLTNRELYEIIYNRREYFIYYDAHLDTETFRYSYREEIFNQNGQSFFDNLFENEKNKPYLIILKKLFPYVYRYDSGQDLKSKYLFGKDPHSESILKSRGISSAKYFDLYFTLTNNTYADIAVYAEKMIDVFTKEDQVYKNIREIKNIVSNDPYEQRELFEQLQLRLEDIPQKNKSILITSLFYMINEVNNNSMFLSLSAKGRAELIIADLLLNLPNEEFKSSIHEWKEKHEKLHAVRFIKYWLEKSEMQDYKKTEEITKLYKGMVKYIYEREIDLYSDQYYYPKNIHSLYFNMKHENKEAMFKTYIDKIMNSSSIYRLLFDIIQFSTGTENRYEFRKMEMDLFTTEEKIDELLEQSQAVTEDEKFVLKVYQVYKMNLKDDWGEAGVRTDRELNIKL